MHPLIAWLAFMFSPSDDWLLKRAYEMMLEPTEIRMTADNYAEMSQRYPSQATDTKFLSLWSEILNKHHDIASAERIRENLIKDKTIDQDLKNDTYLQLAEQALAEGNVDSADKFLDQVASTKNQQQIDLLTDRLFCRLLKGDDFSEQMAALSKINAGSMPPRTQIAFGIAALQASEFDKALAYFPTNSDNSAVLYMRGLAFLKSGNPLEAIPVWQRVHVRDPKSPWAEMAYFQMAEAYFQTGDNRLSRLVCEKNLEEYPEGMNKDRTLFRLAALDFQDKNYDGALAYLEKANLPADLRGRGKVLAAKTLVGKDQPQELYARLVKKSKSQDTAENMYRRSWVLAFSGHFEESLGQAQIALEKFNERSVTPQLLLLQGLSLEHIQHEADALATYQVLVDHFPDTSEAAKSVNLTAMAYMRAGRTEEMVTHVPFLWAKLPETSQRQYPEPLYWLGEAHTKLSRWSDAEESFARFVTFAPSNHELKPYAQFQMAAAQIKQNKTDNALAQLDIFQKSAEQNKKTEWVTLAHLQKGHLLMGDQKYPQAVAEYRAIHVPKAQYYEALALAKMEYYTDAILVWKKLATEFPSDTLAANGLFRAARTEFELGHSTEAVETYQQFVSAYPNHEFVKEARLQSAHALYNSGNAMAALPLYQEYLKNYPTTEDVAMVTPYIASCYAQAGRPLEEMEEGLKGLPPTEMLADVRWDAAAKRFNEKEFEAAGILFTNMLTDTPAHKNAAPAVFYLGESEYQSQNWFAAAGAYRNFLAMASKDNSDLADTARFHSAVALFQQDKLMAAAAQFQSILDETPNSNLAKDAKMNLYLCYHNLGDWATMNKMKEKYGDVSYNEHMDVSSAANLTSFPQ